MTRQPTTPGTIIMHKNEYGTVFVEMVGADILADSSTFRRKRSFHVKGTKENGYEDGSTVPAPDFTWGRIQAGQARALLAKYMPEIASNPIVIRNDSWRGSEYVPA